MSVAFPSGAEPSSAAPIDPAQRFVQILNLLCAAVARQGGAGGLAAPLVLLIWARLRRMAARFATARVRPGAHAPASTSPDHDAGRPASPLMASSRPAPCWRLPQGFGWLVRLVPEASCHSGHLRHLLSQPEMRALVAASPGARRVLRPLCRMLAIAPDREMRAWLPGYASRRRPAPAEVPRLDSVAGDAPGLDAPLRPRLRQNLSDDDPPPSFRACGLLARNSD